MNNSTKLSGYITLGLLAFGLTLSPLSIACYSGCSSSGSGSSSGGSSSSPNQPTTGEGVSNLVKRERTATERSYDNDNGFRALPADAHRYSDSFGHVGLGRGDYSNTGKSIPLMSTRTLELLDSELDDLIDPPPSIGLFLFRPKSLSKEERKRLSKLSADIGRELSIRDRARKAKKDKEATSSANSDPSKDPKSFKANLTLPIESGSSVDIDPLKDPSLFEYDPPPRIESVIPNLIAYTGAYLGGDPSRARDKAKQLDKEAGAKDQEADAESKKAKEFRERAARWEKRRSTAANENQSDGLKEGAEKMKKDAAASDKKAASLKKTAEGLKRSADDHRVTADRWEKRAEKKQSDKTAKPRTTSKWILLEDGRIVEMPTHLGF